MTATPETTLDIHRRSMYELASAGIQMSLSPEDVLLHLRGHSYEWIMDMANGKLDGQGFSELLVHFWRFLESLGFNSEEQNEEVIYLRASLVNYATYNRETSAEWFGNALTTLCEQPGGGFDYLGAIPVASANLY